MKKVMILFAYILLSLPFIARADDPPKVNVRVNTPVGGVEVNPPPPPQPVVVVPAQPPQKVVVQNQAPAPAAPSSGCHCSLVSSSSSALGFISLMPLFSLLYFWKRAGKR